MAASLPAPSNNSLQDLANASTVLGDLQQFGSGSTSTGSDHYPIVGDYIISGVPEPSSFVLAAFGFTAWTASQIRRRRNVLFAVPTG